jgi:hypothetical protein
LAVRAAPAQEATAERIGPRAEGEARPPLVSLEFDPDEPAPLLAQGVTRLVAELKVAGFRVRLLERASSATDADRAEPNEIPPLYASIRLSVVGDRLQIEVDTDSNGTSSRLVLVSGRRDVAVVALQAAEFLSAGLVPRLGLPAARRPHPAAANGEAAAAQAPLGSRPEAFGLALGAAAMTNWASGDALPLLTIHSQLALSPIFSWGTDFYLPVGAARFDAARGSANYRVWLGELDWGVHCLRTPRSTLTLGINAGIARTATAGAPTAPLQPRDPGAWSLALGVGIASEYRLVGALAVIAEARIVTLSPSPVLVVVDDERRLGRPSALLGVGLRVFAQ